MVKNQMGGNKVKKYASKNTTPTTNKLRLSNDEDELYAMVTKMLGNSQCHVVTLHGQTLLCIIRKKFTGKHKHQHFLKSGSWVLVGLRNWETIQSDKMAKCDLLECYSENDKQTICKQSDLNVETLIQEEKKLECDEPEEPCEIIFSDI